MPQKLAFRRLSHWNLSARAFITGELLFGFSVCSVLDAIVGNICVIGSTCCNVFKEHCAENYHGDRKDTVTRRNLSIYDTSFQYISAVCSHSIHPFTIALDSALACIAKYK
mmetsp:Transcript_1578/g.2367  ORF Transcript_1578/g.2367 Transcript_1578/m.2367 type:complete len:111 (-) Transcript_1578:52-384(-)